MPVRFVCPACHKLLSITSRKIGSHVQCPQCQATIIVPDPHDSSTHATLDPRDEAEPGEPATEVKLPLVPPPPGMTWGETPKAVKRAPTDIGKAPPADTDLITITRRTVYLQAVLIAAVAVLAFIAGYVIGAAGR
jgi:hypothetical protein